jgi:hypothetical protein
MSDKSKSVKVPAELVSKALQESAAGDRVPQPVHVSADLIDLVEVMRKHQRVFFLPSTRRADKGEALRAARKAEKQVDDLIQLFRVEQKQYADFVGGKVKDTDPQLPADQPGLMAAGDDLQPVG